MSTLSTILANVSFAAVFVLILTLVGCDSGA